MNQEVIADRNSFWVNRLPEFLRARVSGRHNLQAVLGNSGWLVSDRVFRLGVNFFVYLWVARYLGPTQYGQLNYAIALTSLAASLAALGADSIVIRELVKTPDRRNVLLGSAMILKLIGGALATATVLAMVLLLRPGDWLSFWLVFLFAVGFVAQSLNVIDLYFRGIVKSKYTVLSSNAAFILMAVAKVVLVLTKAPLIAFAATGTAEGLLTVIFLCVAYRMHRQNMFEWRFSANVMVGLLKDSWPLILTGVSIMIAMRVDQVLIGQMLNDKQVGLYAAAVRISEIWYFVPVTLASSTFPALIEYRRNSDALFYQKLQVLYNALVRIGLAIALLMTFLSKPIIVLLFGKSYAGSAPVLNILIWSGIPICFGCAWSNWMVLENRTKTMFLLQVNGSIANLVLNLVLIRRFGILGSAYATLISYWVPHTIVAALLPSQRKALLMLGKALVPFSGYLESKFRSRFPRGQEPV
jgi:PST family polysaccharide transporter